MRDSSRSGRNHRGKLLFNLFGIFLQLLVDTLGHGSGQAKKKHFRLFLAGDDQLLFVVHCSTVSMVQMLTVYRNTTASYLQPGVAARYDIINLFSMFK